MLPSMGSGRGPGGRPFGGRVRRINFVIHPTMMRRRVYCIRLMANMLTVIEQTIRKREAEEQNC